MNLPASKPGIDLSKAVFFRPVSAQEYIALLKSAFARKHPHKKNGYYDYGSAIAYFNDFLMTSNPELTPDEAMLDDFKIYLNNLKPDYSPLYVKSLCSRIRCMTNRFPASLLQRPLASNKQVKTYARFNRLTVETQAILSHFKQDGRDVTLEWADDGTETRRPVLGLNRLSNSYRQGIVSDAVKVLEIIGKNDLLQVNAGDAETYLKHYEQNGKRNSAINQLAGMKSLYQNLWAMGRVTKNPFHRYGTRIVTINSDFVPPDGIVVLRDLTTLNRSSLLDVRRRMICMMGYDFGLRIGETSLLWDNDFSFANCVVLRLRSEVQKGRNKPETILRSYFPETMELIQLYLDLRKQTNPDHNMFLVDQAGKPIGRSGAESAVKSCCEDLGILTNSGKPVASHRFRHSMGMLNCTEIGLKLQTYDIMRRLRHTSFELVTSTYTTNNPLLQELAHNAILERNGSPVRGVEIRDTTSMMTESDAIRLLAKFNITVDGLRDYGRRNQILNTKDASVFYNREAITELSNNYLTKANAMTIMKLEKSGFFYWQKQRAVTVLRIGKACLVPKDDVMAKVGAR